MAFKEASDVCTGSGVIYGAPDLKKIAQYLNGGAIDCCEPVLPRDTVFTISDSTDATALIRFNATCITTCTTRVVTVPDADVTINRALIPANFANATDGELITWDCAGAATTVPVGTINHVLTSGGAGQEPTFKGVQESLIIAVGDETTALTTGCDKVTFRMPYAFTVTSVRASVNVAATGAALLTVDINECNTSIMTCCKIVFDAGETHIQCAATAPVVSDTSLADNAEIEIDIDTIGCCVAGAGLKVYIIGNRT